MRILFLTENFPPECNAAATRVYERACWWVRWGHEVTVIACAPNFPEGRVFPGYANDWYRVEDVDGIRVVRVKTYIARNQGFFRRTLDFLSFLFSGFCAGLIQPRFDLVAATSPQFFSAVAGWLVGIVRRRPFVFELGDLWPASIAALGAMRKRRLYRVLETMELFLYRRAAAVVALTGAFKRDLVSRGIDPDKIAVVVNGVDLDRYAPASRDETLAADCGLGGRFVVGYIGTHGMAHGLENVLAAAALLRDEPDVRFLFVGTGAAREALLAEAVARGLANVVFVPRQPKERMPAFWSLCDVALIHLKDLPVFETVIPSKMFEAMGMGLPLLMVAPAGEASAIVERERAGLWVPAGDPAAFAAAVRRLHHDRGLLAELGRNALAAAPRYSRERQARDMLAALEAVRAGRALPRGGEG